MEQILDSIEDVESVRTCICPLDCDCQAPEPKHGIALLSENCPVHNLIPDQYPQCEATTHRNGALGW